MTESLEERDPVAAIRALREGIADDEGRIRTLNKEIVYRQEKIGHMRETLGMVIARNLDAVDSEQDD